MQHKKEGSTVRFAMPELSGPLLVVRWWYDVTTPSPPGAETSLKQRERMRQAYLTSTVLLLSLFILCVVLLGALLEQDGPLLLIIGIAILVQCVALWLNRRAKVTAAGILLVSWFALGLSLFLFTTPGPLSVANLTGLYLPIELELLAVSLLPAWGVFAVFIYNSFLIEAVLFLRPHTTELDALLASSSYQVHLQPLLLQLLIAVISYLWVSSATRALARADRAEEIARLTHTIAEYEQQRFVAAQTELRLTLAFEQQRRLNSLKDQFLINVSHELRTPLTAVEGYLELLKQYQDRLDGEQRTLFVQKAIESCDDLTSLVNQVLEATSASEEIMPVRGEAILVEPFVREVLEHLDPREVLAYTIQLRIPPQLMVWADQRSLAQVLRNLLSNAFKYAPKYTLISIEGLYETAGAHIQLCIEDQGPGIPPDEQEQLFEKFVRLKRDQAGATRGTGLGLYISKQLVEAMSGRIWVESSVNAGSRFYVALPAVNNMA